MAGFGAEVIAAGTIESEAMHTKYGGSVEYVAAVLLVVQILLAHHYLIRRRAIRPRPAWFALVAFLVLAWSATFISLCLTLSGAMYTGNRVPVGPGTAISAAGYFWIMLSSAAIAIVAAVRFVLVRIPSVHSASRRRWLQATAVAAVGAPVAAAAFGAFIERNQYGVRELDFPIAGLHPDLDGFRIVQVSDLHVSPFLSAQDARRVVDMANELHADLAVFTGDLISERGDPLDDAIRELIRLRADEGVLGCMGNHEEYVGCRNYLARQTARAGIVFLREAATQIHRGAATLNIAGVDHQRSSDPAGYLPGAERHIIRGATNLLLSHNPDVFPTAIQRGFEAVLSGHTHGGQINVEILHQNVNPARFRTPFTSGLYRIGQSERTAASCFVTNGIGTIGMPIRLGAPPEIALLRLRRA
jgi:predicted MPP superfamily phosphohydrolase